MNNQNQVREVVGAVEEALANSVACLLFFGSVQQEDESKHSDLDFLLVLEHLDLSGLDRLRTKLRQITTNLDIPYILAQEIPEDLTDFKIGAHGSYFALELVDAQALVGSNPFEAKQSPSRQSVVESLTEKIVQYLTYARRFYLESNRHRSAKDYYQLIKRLDKAFLDLSRIWQLKDLDPTYIQPIGELVDQAKQLNTIEISDRNLMFVLEVFEMISFALETNHDF